MPSRRECCDPNAPATLLASKFDDDDHDGNPLDENFPTIDDEDDDISDHAWIRDDFGVFHLFFQNEGKFGPAAIEHYTSTDLKTLRYVGVALRPQPGAWDSQALWAPCVVRSGATYYMFYTGVEGTGADEKERIGLATSTDLVTWTRWPGNRCPGAVGEGCVYECRECWTTVGGTPGSFNQQCRDPFVIRDPDTGHRLLFATTRSVNQYGEVTVAHSTDLTTWTGDGFIDATRRLANGTGAQATGGMAENPFVMQHDGVNYLLFTDWWDPEDTVTVSHPRTAVQYATSPTLGADTLGSANWTYRGYTPDVGVNAIEVQHIRFPGDEIWVMSQSIANPHAGIPKSLRRRLRLKCVVWGDGTSFDTANFSFLPFVAGHSTSPMSVEAGDEADDGH